MTDSLLRVEKLTKHFPVTRGVLGRVVGQVRAVDDVSFDVAPGETLGLVGESGCGKTTVGRSVLQLVRPTSGSVLFEGKDLSRLSTQELRGLRRELQVIFQDPFSSLNPRLRVVDLIGEALEIHDLARGPEMERRVRELLRRVGLSPAWLNRYPHEFSGGQRQRIGIARAIALQPKLVVCDEAVSALDVSIQAQVINLLIELRREMNLSYLFIAHDLSVVRHVSHRVAVMYLGQLVELAPAKRLFDAPAHPYTRALLSAIPVPIPGRERRRIVLQGDVPSPLDPPRGCRFHTRCPAVRDQCHEEEPRTVQVEPGHGVKCIHADGLAGASGWFDQMSGRIERATTENTERAISSTPIGEGVQSGMEGHPVESSDEPTEPGDEPPLNFERVGFVLLGIGALTTVFGSAAMGVLLAASAYFALVRPRLVFRGRTDLALLVAFVGCAAAGNVEARVRKRSLAESQLTRLSTEIAARRRLTGELPTELGELGWRLYPIFDDGKPIDPWGRPWHYRAKGTDGRAFDLGSAGPDGVRSGDDVGHIPH